MKGKVYRISISGTLVRVSKNVYLSYYRSKRRDRYSRRFPVYTLRIG